MNRTDSVVGSNSSLERPTTVTQTVYDRLRTDILSGALGPGNKLRIDFLRRRYATGGSPVREALSRLSAEGLAAHEIQRGFFVAPVSLEELRELVQVRCWVEERALRESMARRTATWEEDLIIAYHRLSRYPRYFETEPVTANPHWEVYHHAFHHALLARCGSPILLDFCQSLRDQTDRYRLLAANHSVAQRNDRDEHRMLMEAVLDARVDDAVERLISHYECTMAFASRYFAGNGATTAHHEPSAED